MKHINIKKNLVKIGDGLYSDNGMYIYKGVDVNNYVKYSGRIWRIVSIDKKNNSVKLITDRPQTSLVWGVDMDYNNSYVRSWLNNSDNEIKSFYESLSNTEIIRMTNVCVDKIVNNNISCDEIVTDRVGLLSAYEYTQAGGDESYLNIGEYWWLSNTDDNHIAWYVYSKGTINNTSYSASTYFNYGVRPVITLDGSANVISGDGSIDNPINLDVDTANILEEKYVGDYITYSSYNWRIIEKNDDYIKVVMDGFVKEDDTPLITNFGSTNYCSLSKGMCYYLNTKFYQKLDKKEYIVMADYNTGKYDKTNKYDFNKISEYKEKMNVGLLQIGELFVTEKSKYFLGSRTITSDNNIYEVLEDGRIYAGVLSDELRIRPTICLKKDLVIISGNGSSKRPYVIG